MKFHENFVWGSATAAYQIEGAANEEGRGASIWDRFSHIEENIVNGDTGDVACDHYHRYKDDIKLMKEMGLKGYRFSISWSRIFPTGRGMVNQKGIDFYNSLVDELIKNGIEPAVTLYHWDLPQALEDIGGWGNRDTVDYFVEYATYMFKLLGDRVKKWSTHNEPWVAAFAGNLAGRHAPGNTDLKLAVQVSHHLILSHAKAVEVYKKLNHKDGKIGIVLDLHPIVPATDSKEDYDTSILVDGYQNRWFLDAVLKGKYPEDILKFYKEKLVDPVIMPGDMEIIAGNSMDYLGVNYYFRKVVKRSPHNKIFQFEEVKPEGAEYTEMNWEVYPRGLYDLLIRIKEEYNNPHIYITENGAAFKDDKIVNGVVDDEDRLRFLSGHFDEAYKAIEAGVKLDGYYVWSLMDNFEWALGYSKRFGLIFIDFKTQERIWKKSAIWYKGVIKNNGIKG
ncbi:MAG: beta-glucosidase [Clostridiaceae bacterium]|nr:beta-glucosidase [Clostridiaceae bacterium]